jgi:pimeloyl-ACP methyl ester carboxylesterase
MTATVHPGSASRDTRLERYRAAEARLWRAYDLDPVERFVETADGAGHLRVVDVGTGDPVLFIPGTGGTGPYWAPLVRELAADHRCLLLDRPGWGLSTPADYRRGSYGQIAAETVTRVLDGLEIELADVVGASIGDLWALRSAQHAPTRVRRLTLIGSGPIMDIPIPRFIRLLTSPVGALMVRLPFSPRMARSQLEAIGHGPSVAAGRMDEFIEWRVAFARDTSSMRHERAMVRAILRRDGWLPGFIPRLDELAGVTAPTLFVFGSADPTGTVDTWRTFIAALPDAELRVVDGAGHMPWWDEPGAVGRLIRGHLEARV